MERPPDHHAALTVRCTAPCNHRWRIETPVSGTVAENSRQQHATRRDISGPVWTGVWIALYVSSFRVSCDEQKIGHLTDVVPTPFWHHSLHDPTEYWPWRGCLAAALPLSTITCPRSGRAFNRLRSGLSMRLPTVAVAPLRRHGGVFGVLAEPDSLAMCRDRGLAMMGSEPTRRCWKKYRGAECGTRTSNRHSLAGGAADRAGVHDEVGVNGTVGGE